MGVIPPLHSIMNMKRDVIIYVDMDGVLAAFDQAVRKKLGAETVDLSSDKRWNIIIKYNNEEEPWFYSLPLLPDARTLWKFLTKNFRNVEILSATGGNAIPDAGRQKRQWIADNFGPKVKVHTVKDGKDKAAYADYNTVLIDDRSRAIDPFIAAGGIGIKHTSAANTIATLRVMMSDWV